MTETDALALGYTYKHKGLKMSEKVNQECSSMTANKLATEIEFTAIPCLQEVATMLRQQQAEIEGLKADNEQMCKALLKATRLIIRKSQEQ